MTKVYFLALAAGILLCGNASAETEVTPPAKPAPVSTDSGGKNAEVANFALLDYRGNFHELRREQSKAVVLFFTANGCPIARQSISKLKRLEKRFGREVVTVWLVDSSPSDDRASVEKEAAEFGIWPMTELLDEYQIVARNLGARRTCEAIAIDTQTWKPFFRGGIDDQMTPGAKKPKPKEKYLEAALTEFLNGKPVTVASAPVEGCAITLETPEKEITYTKDIAPILKAKCVGCHSPGNIGPFAMSNYKKVRGWSDTIQETLATRRMPPWHADPHFGTFANDRSITPTETKAILRWIELGSPRGEGEDPLENHLPEPAPKWPMGSPDYVIKLSQPEEIPATGVLDYRHRIVESTLTEDHWVNGIYVRPDNKCVLHHLIVRFKGRHHDPSGEVFFVGWAPGNMQLPFPNGAGKFVPKGVKFDVELHYTTDGKAETDNSEVGLYFLKDTPKMSFETRVAASLDFDIPPGEPNSRWHAITSFPKDTLIYDLTPHMHLRGSWFKFEALYPNGTREVLLSVPRYDFNWQTEYRLTDPKRMPAGTWLLCTGGYDNSKANPNNPDFSKRIHHGEQSFDEMFMGFMNVAEVPSTEGKQLSSVK
jgi:hypothetical protein